MRDIFLHYFNALTQTIYDNRALSYVGAASWFVQSGFIGLEPVRTGVGFG